MALAIAAVLWAIGLAAAIAFHATASPQISGLRIGLNYLACAMTGLWVYSAWFRSAQGELRWDGEQWFWYCGRIEVTVRVRAELDLQHVLLLSFDMVDDSPKHGTRGWLREWIWLEKSRQPQAWADLRRAVYSRARTATRQAMDDQAPLASVSSP